MVENRSLGLELGLALQPFVDVAATRSVAKVIFLSISSVTSGVQMNEQEFHDKAPLTLFFRCTMKLLNVSSGPTVYS